MAIRLSEKHGVNPTLLICPICKKNVGIGLLGRIKGDAEAPRQMYGELCDDCKSKYITILEVESETNKKLTGRRAFIDKNAIPFDCPDGVCLMPKDDFSKLKKA